MPSAKEIRRRIKSVSNTRQIIKAMELVSVVKMQKAVNNNLSSRPYSLSANEILTHLCEELNPNDHPYLKQNSGNKKLIILFTSDRGLCGGLNIKAIKKAIEEAKDSDSVEFLTIGKRGRDFLKIYGYKIIAEFSGIDERPSFNQMLPVVRVVTGDFLAGKFDKVVMVYSHFKSTLVQEPIALNILPFSGSKLCQEGQDKITFEPGKAKILGSLIPRILEIQVWQSFLESVASEHSARMVAMKNANENALSLIDDLTLTFNQTRQAGITREIAEISAGKMTLEE